MKSSMKQSEAKQVYNLLRSAKLTKMADADKFIVIRNAHNLKKVAEEFDALVQEAVEKLKADGYDERYKAAAEYERTKQGSQEEYIAFLGEAAKLNSDVNACLKEEAGKDISGMLTPLSEEAFARLVESNDYNVEQVIVLQEVLMK
jgi:flagellin-specific chaperone FliS